MVVGSASRPAHPVPNAGGTSRSWSGCWRSAAGVRVVDVIPADVRRHAVAPIGFWIFDNNAVALETPSAAVKVTRPQEIAVYLAMFDKLRAEGFQGEHARQMVVAIRNETRSS